MACEITRWLSRIFTERQKTGRIDLEAVEMGLRTTLHQAGAMALEQLLQYPEPAAAQRQRPCPCGQTAQYIDLRSKTLKTLRTAVGQAKLQRPYYLCGHCGEGQFRCRIGRGQDNQVAWCQAHAGGCRSGDAF